MLGLLAVTVPFFALVLAGFLAARQGLLPLEAVPGLNAFVLFFALPCMLFRFGSQLPVAELLDPRLIGLYLVCAAGILGLTILVTRSPGRDGRDTAFGALVAAFPNSGFMGVPLITSLLGARAAGPVINTMLVDFFFTSSVALALAQPIRTDPAHATRGHPRLRALGRSLRAALGNPMPWSIALGGLASWGHWHVPAPIGKIVNMLADAASPVALFTIGAVLWRARVAARSEARSASALRAGPAQGELALQLQALPVAAIKLLVHPLLVLGMGLVARMLGLAISDFELTVLVLTAALPSASNVTLLTERYGADTGRVARIILVSTTLAFLTFTATAWVFGVR